jgi:hypothetical protein
VILGLASEWVDITPLNDKLRQYASLSKEKLGKGEQKSSNWQNQVMKNNRLVFADRYTRSCE